MRRPRFVEAALIFREVFSGGAQPLDHVARYFRRNLLCADWRHKRVFRVEMPLWPFQGVIGAAMVTILSSIQG